MVQPRLAYAGVVEVPEELCGPWGEEGQEEEIDEVVEKPSCDNIVTEEVVTEKSESDVDNPKLNIELVLKLPHGQLNISNINSTNNKNSSSIEEMGPSDKIFLNFISMVEELLVDVDSPEETAFVSTKDKSISSIEALVTERSKFTNQSENVNNGFLEDKESSRSSSSENENHTLHFDTSSESATENDKTDNQNNTSESEDNQKNYHEQSKYEVEIISGTDQNKITSGNITATSQNTNGNRSKLSVSGSVLNGSHDDSILKLTNITQYNSTTKYVSPATETNKLLPTNAKIDSTLLKEDQLEKPPDALLIPSNFSVPLAYHIIGKFTANSLANRTVQYGEDSLKTDGNKGETETERVQDNDDFIDVGMMNEQNISTGWGDGNTFVTNVSYTKYPVEHNRLEEPKNESMNYKTTEAEHGFESDEGDLSVINEAENETIKVRVSSSNTTERTELNTKGAIDQGTLDTTNVNNHDNETSDSFKNNQEHINSMNENTNNRNNRNETFQHAFGNDTFDNGIGDQGVTIKSQEIYIFDGKNTSNNTNYPQKSNITDSREQEVLNTINLDFPEATDIPHSTDQETLNKTNTQNSDTPSLDGTHNQTTNETSPGDIQRREEDKETTNGGENTDDTAGRVTNITYTNVWNGMEDKNQANFTGFVKYSGGNTDNPEVISTSIPSVPTETEPKTLDPNLYIVVNRKDTTTTKRTTRSSKTVTKLTTTPMTTPTTSTTSTTMTTTTSVTKVPTLNSTISNDDIIQKSLDQENNSNKTIGAFVQMISSIDHGLLAIIVFLGLLAVFLATEVLCKGLCGGPCCSIRSRPGSRVSVAPYRPQELWGDDLSLEGSEFERKVDMEVAAVFGMEAGLMEEAAQHKSLGNGDVPIFLSPPSPQGSTVLVTNGHLPSSSSLVSTKRSLSLETMSIDTIYMINELEDDTSLNGIEDDVFHNDTGENISPQKYQEESYLIQSAMSVTVCKSISPASPPIIPKAEFIDTIFLENELETKTPEKDAGNDVERKEYGENVTVETETNQEKLNSGTDFSDKSPPKDSMVEVSVIGVTPPFNNNREAIDTIMLENETVTKNIEKEADDAAEISEHSKASIVETKANQQTPQSNKDLSDKSSPEESMVNFSVMTVTVCGPPPDITYMENNTWEIFQEKDNNNNENVTKSAASSPEALFPLRRTKKQDQLDLLKSTGKGSTNKSNGNLEANDEIKNIESLNLQEDITNLTMGKKFIASMKKILDREKTIGDINVSILKVSDQEMSDKDVSDQDISHTEGLDQEGSDQESLNQEGLDRESSDHEDSDQQISDQEGSPQEGSDQEGSDHVILDQGISEQEADEFDTEDDVETSVSAFSQYFSNAISTSSSSSCSPDLPRVSSCSPPPPFPVSFLRAPPAPRPEPSPALPGPAPCLLPTLSTRPDVLYSFSPSRRVGALHFLSMTSSSLPGPGVRDTKTSLAR